MLISYKLNHEIILWRIKKKKKEKGENAVAFEKLKLKLSM